MSFSKQSHPQTTLLGGSTIPPAQVWAARSQNRRVCRLQLVSFPTFKHPMIHYGSGATLLLSPSRQHVWQTLQNMRKQQNMRRAVSKPPNMHNNAACDIQLHVHTETIPQRQQPEAFIFISFRLFAAITAPLGQMSTFLRDAASVWRAGV